MNPFLAEVRVFACNFAPVGWAFCNGQLLPIAQNTALFSLLGTYYGGNGQSTFALPNLQNAAVLGHGQGAGLTDRFIGEVGGTSSVTLTSANLPGHTHSLVGSSGDGVLASPANDVPAGPGADRDLFLYNNAATGTLATMAPASLSVSGGGQPHNNYMPYLGLNFCIALQGVYPARN